MIRRSIAGLLLGPSLLIGSLAWSGFVALRTVFDADRSREVAEELLDNDQVRGQLIDNLARAIEATLPAEVTLTDEQIEQASAGALDNPAVEELVLTALTSTHGAFLGEGDVPHTLDLAPVTDALRASVVEAVPALDSSLPASPTVRVELPTERIPNAGPIRDFLQRAVPIMAGVAIAGALLALFTTTDRASVLTKAGVWALSTTAFYLVIGYGLPWLLRKYAPDQAEVFAALVAALLRSTLVPSIVLALCGVTAVALAILWPSQDGEPAARRQEPAPAPASAGGPRRSAWPGPVPQPLVYPEPLPRRGADPTAAFPSADPPPRAGHPSTNPSMRAVTPVPPPPAPATPPEPAPPPPEPAPARALPPRPPPPMPRFDLPAPLPTVASTRRTPPPADSTGPEAGENTTDPPDVSEPTPGTSGRLPTKEQGDRRERWLPPRWVEGLGWVLDPDDPKPPPPNARWVEGIGHVVPGPPPA